MSDFDGEFTDFLSTDILASGDTRAVEAQMAQGSFQSSKSPLVAFTTMYYILLVLIN